MNWRTTAAIGAVLAVIAGGVVSTATAEQSGDDRLAAARRFVEKSDRYMHHSKLRRGMEGYGVTVMAGTELVRFKAVVVSVVTKWGPHQDVILARLSGQNLEYTGIIAGMSGSPVYFKDPDDGKEKLVGAVAYGWQAQKDPLCGLQPITQMLAAGRVFSHMEAIEPGKPSDKGKPIGAGKDGGEGKAKADPKAADRPVSGGAGPLPAGGDLDGYLAAVLDPNKVDFLPLCMPRLAARRPAAGGSLVPLTTPLMVSGLSAAGLAEATRRLEPLGIMPVASGGVNADLDKALKNTRFVPGGGIAVPIVSGDADMAAVGTVTDVYKGRLLAFGHSFFAEGATELPMAPAYIHTTVAGVLRSFKLGAGLEVQGTLRSDEAVAVSGEIGPKPKTIPMTVTIDRKDATRKEVYNYRLCNHRSLTAMGAMIVLRNAVGGWHEMPEQHTISYSVSVDFGKLGKYQTTDISTDRDAGPASSDAMRPITALLSNPFGERIAPKRIDVEIKVQPGSLAASLLNFKLDGQVYRPGETITGTVVIRPFRKRPQPLTVRFELPDDIEDGTYELTVCDAPTSMIAEQREMPHMFAPRTTEQLLKALQHVVSSRSDQLYLRMPLPSGGGLAIERAEMPDLPASKAQILSQADILETRSFRRSLVQTLKTRYLITGSASATFTVQRDPETTILRKQ